MTTPVTPPARGGMPKWLIILLVILLIIMLGCCGIFGTCVYLARQGAQTAAARFDELRKEMEVEAAKQQAELQRRAREAGDGAAAPESGNTPRRSGVTAAEMPSNFPDDIPMYPGLSPMFSQADTVHDGGTVMCTSGDDMKTIGAYYGREMAGKGWKQDRSTAVGEMVVQIYSKDDRQATISIHTDEEKKSSVSIHYAKK